MKMKEKPAYFPILINLVRFDCLVIGGGKVASRKVLSLLEFGANITVLSPKTCLPLKKLDNKKKIKIIKKNYSVEFIKDYKIVFCATDNPVINKTVREDCTKEGILLNVADNPQLCDFILPANVRRGDLIISISSQGKAPFFVKAIKKKIDHFIPQIYNKITDLAAEFRKQIIQNKKIDSVKVKTNLFKRFTSINWESKLVENGDKIPKYYIRKILK
jgi:precorrin-2 dehydrogenase/sirohydrochlorin ferrochelatase